MTNPASRFGGEKLGKDEEGARNEKSCLGVGEGKKERCKVEVEIGDGTAVGSVTQDGMGFERFGTDYGSVFR